MFPRLSEYKERPVEWIWERRLARGMLTLLESDPGMGKGLISFDIAARMTTGRPMPCENPAAPTPLEEKLNFIGEPPPRDVLLCSGEDMLQFTERQRAEAAGASAGRILCMTSLRPDGRTFEEIVDATVDTIKAAYIDTRVGLVIIDPVAGFFPGLESGGAGNVRYALTALADLAHRRGCAILAIRHLNKSAGRSAIYRGGGSIAFESIARFVFCLGFDPANPAKRVLACVKNNFGERPPSLRYEIVPFKNERIDSARIEWLGPTDLTADDILARPRHRRPESPALRAESLLRRLLASGPVTRQDALEQAEIAGLSRTALKKAKANLAIRSRRVGYGSHARWIWSLPASQGE